MSGPLRVTFHALLGLVLAAALALGWAWHRDRTRVWDPPAFTDETFVALRAGQRADSRSDRGGQATWMMPVNPRCPRCLAMLRRVGAESARSARPERLVALIVDSRRRPDAGLLHALPTLPLWWDRDGVWRQHWGHRLYGELIEFDAAGRYLRTFSARDALRRLTANAPGDSTAPAIKRGTGS